MDSIDTIVIGAGVVGLAVARALARQGREVVILEAAETFGTGVSSRNSEVIHAGIYYPPGSLKSLLCITGRSQLYDYCERRGIAHRRCGKLIVATDESQINDLRAIGVVAGASGVELDMLDGPAARALEPELTCVAALASKYTGIIDSHQYMQALLADCEQHGATLVCRSRVARLWLETASVLVAINEDMRPTVRARLVVNCASLHAPDVARSIEGFPETQIPQPYYARGHYFSLAGRSPFSRLVYPIPEPGGLGVHLTLDLAGQARFGPDVEWIDKLEYDVDITRSQRFYSAIRRFWPQLAEGQLVPAYAGVRPKISAPGAPAADFRIDGPRQHGVAGIINLFGIESPGLTASLAIADHVAALARA